MKTTRRITALVSLGVTMSLTVEADRNVRSCEEVIKFQANRVTVVQKKIGANLASMRPAHFAGLTTYASGRAEIAACSS